ncbi:aspartate/glutamate racemase family protein [Amorphus sp. 3PC139-8]|uniref:aspartate/glutamate racemase family protein n=1 Tax=Amorphus sp. 3PC139-8 TaxID=2735676 RepID=UPI00345DAC83
MVPIGLIGGMSAASTALYYERLNALARTRFGGLHSAEIVMWSVDFAPIAELQTAGAWDIAGTRLADTARRLEGAGAGLIVLATNTMHKVAADIEAAVSVPFVHIADATGTAVRRAGLRRPGLMATRFTMEEDFYISRLAERFGLEVIVPDAADRAETHRIIYDELCRGDVRAQSRETYREIAERLVARGADSLILGCTEVGLLIDGASAPVPVFDTTAIHAEQAFEIACGAMATA